MVQRNGTREVCGTRLMMLRAWISKNVMPRKPGVSNDRVVIALRSNRAGAPQAALPGWPASIRIPSQRIAATIERVFEPGNAARGGAGQVLGWCVRLSGGVPGLIRDREFDLEQEQRPGTVETQ